LQIFENFEEIGALGLPVDRGSVLRNALDMPRCSHDASI
jgi:hypothetical protein